MESQDIKVLIVDPSAQMRERLRMAMEGLEGLGTVQEAETVFEALRILDAGLPDMVILEISLPDGQGIKLVREIKKRSRATKVIVFTEMSMEEYRISCIEAGADFFFIKQKGIDEFRDLLDSLVQFFRWEVAS